MQVDAVTSLSHEFRTPLAVVIAGLGLLQHQHDKLDTSARAEILSTALRHATELSEVIDKVLAESTDGRALPSSLVAA